LVLRKNSTELTSYPIYDFLNDLVIGYLVIFKLKSIKAKPAGY
jgi:hypothetical protein